MTLQSYPLRVINSLAPVRICDNGVMTDTWFAKHGKVFNIAVTPYAEVQIEVFPREDHDDQITLFAENYNDRYIPHLHPEKWDRYPLLEAAIDCTEIPNDIALKINVFSDAPIGGSIGSSAAITVALLGALNRLTARHLSLHELAYLAHSVETKKLKQESGIQDQLCAAFGGINYIEIFEYPYATISRIHTSVDVRLELENRMLLIYLGKSHKSSDVHEDVIESLEHGETSSKVLDALRVTAEQARDAIYNGDFNALGQSMIICTDAQRSLHPKIICPDAERVIEICKEHGALGWKVNGAGGQGGSLSILCNPMAHSKRSLIREIEEENRIFRNIPIRFSPHGLQVWETRGP